MLSIEKKDACLVEILKTLQGIDLKSSIEILANAFLELGVQNSPTLHNQEITMQNIYSLVLDDVHDNGETLGNSLIRQGLVLIQWLNEGKKDVQENNGEKIPGSV